MKSQKRQLFDRKTITLFKGKSYAICEEDPKSNGFLAVVPNIHPKPRRKWEQFPPKSRMRKTLFLIRILPGVSSHCSRQETAVNCSYITLPHPGLWWSSPIQPWTWLLLFWYTYYRSRSPALTFGWILSINIFAVLSLYINEWNGNFIYLLKLHLCGI